MIQTQCGGCGLIMGYDESMAWRVTACSGCGRAIIIQPGLAQQGLFGRKDLTSKGAGVICGLLILATICIPWCVDPLRMSWEELRHQARPEVIFIISLWAAGLAALVMAFATRAMVLAVAYLAIGGGSIAAIFIHAAGRGAGISLAMLFPLLEDAWALRLATVCALLGLIVLSSLRARIGSAIPLNLLQMLCSIGAAALLAICGYKMIDWILSYPHGLPSHRLAPVIFAMVFLGLAAVGCLLAFGHSLAFRSPGRAVSGIAMGLIWVALLGQIFFGIIMYAVEFKDIKVIFGPLVVAMMIVPIFLIAAEGLTALLANITALCTAPPNKIPPLAVAQPQSALTYQPAGQPSPVQAQAVMSHPIGAAAAQHHPQTAAARLNELVNLRNQGLITQDEYNAKRAKIIELL
ncbi:MAG: hypothetical protein HZA50_03730 [Planctomycetes bacterium]|nr:hypothetical protein [Planctomycetota bacterium]